MLSKNKFFYSFFTKLHTLDIHFISSKFINFKMAKFTTASESPSGEGLFIYCNFMNFLENYVSFWLFFSFSVSFFCFIV